ncbi:hypothetical protein [Lysobacter sp. Hz 25]|uniref:hypothetical protein n=1 Tax=Lysobacter sp. Hz 25 TaxID=3383698 RepID=UPI0038D3CC1A
MAAAKGRSGASRDQGMGRHCSAIVIHRGFELSLSLSLSLSLLLLLLLLCAA